MTTPARPPHDPEPGRLRGRIDAWDGRHGRLYVEDGGGYAHFTGGDWAAGGRPVLGLTVTFTPTAGGQARAVRPSESHDGDSRRGVIDAVIALGDQRGSGRIATAHGPVYFEPREWRGSMPPTPGMPVVFLVRGRHATRVEPEPPAAPAPEREPTA